MAWAIRFNSKRLNEVWFEISKTNSNKIQLEFVQICDILSNYGQNRSGNEMKNVTDSENDNKIPSVEAASKTYGPTGEKLFQNIAIYIEFMVCIEKASEFLWFYEWSESMAYFKNTANSFSFIYMWLSSRWLPSRCLLALQIERSKSNSSLSPGRYQVIADYLARLFDFNNTKNSMNVKLNFILNLNVLIFEWSMMHKTVLKSGEDIS